jgi:hypothetical protein
MAVKMKYAAMTAEDHAARARAYAALKAAGYRQPGRKTQRQRAAEVAAVVTAALRAAGLTVVDAVSEPSVRPESPMLTWSGDRATRDAEYARYQEQWEAYQKAYVAPERAREKAGGYYVVRHDYTHGPMPEVEYMPTPDERVAWKLPD